MVFITTITDERIRKVTGPFIQYYHASANRDPVRVDSSEVNQELCTYFLFYSSFLFFFSNYIRIVHFDVIGVK